MSTCAYLNMHICIYVHIYLKASFYSLSPERDDLVANVMTAAVTEGNGNAPARGPLARERNCKSWARRSGRRCQWVSGRQEGGTAHFYEHLDKFMERRSVSGGGGK